MNRELSDMYGKCTGCGGNLTAGHECSAFGSRTDPEKKSKAAPLIHGFTCPCGVFTKLPEPEEFSSAIRIECGGCHKTWVLTPEDEDSPKVRYRKALAQMDEWIRMLHTAPRTGADTDDPEGSRVITISDTLATNLADCLRELRDTAMR